MGGIFIPCLFMRGWYNFLMEAFIIVFLIFAGLFFLLRKENKRKIEYNNHKNEQIESVTALDRGTWSERNLVYELLEHGIVPGARYQTGLVIDLNGPAGNIFYLMCV